MRASGILMHLSSLPSDYGVGAMGKAAYEFVDFLEAAGQRYWQILPIGPTSYGDSPYQSFSIHAGNPYFIDLDLLAQQGLLKEEAYKKLDWGKNTVDYALLYQQRFPVLRCAFEQFLKQDLTAFETFLQENDHWISNYGLFMSIKEAHNGAPWWTWEEGLRFRDSHSLWMFRKEHEQDILFWAFLQYAFFCQWTELKKYANQKNIEIIGDIPIYVAQDSAEVWVYPDLFELDENLLPTHVAGCPPDAFSPDGQLWGNPLYRWDRLRETHYDWWVERLKAAVSTYDIVRIDHFRGFESYYSIPAADTTAANGQWRQGPGMELFDVLRERLGELPVIAEDLGFLTAPVKELLKQSGFPGMKVLEFAFDPREESDYLPYRYDKNCVVYPGTHDNNTILGWAEELDTESLHFCMDFLDTTSIKSLSWKMIRLALSSVADTAIIQMQDYLELGAGARMNIPSTLGGNWCWRAGKQDFSAELAEKIATVTKLYGRYL